MGSPVAGRDPAGRGNQNLVIELRSAEGNVAHVPQLAADLTRIPVDVIMASAQALIVAKGATTTIPIVMMGISYPVERV